VKCGGTIWQLNAKNLKKHLPNAPCAQANILPTTVEGCTVYRAVHSTGLYKMRDVNCQTEINKFQVDKVSRKIT
jgi:hypothetical protein